MALICHCRLVSDHRVLAEIDDGACSVADVQARCGAATRCGGCLPAVESLVASATSRLVTIGA
jgi:bacterioferritin-associated ferredoxin